MLRHYSTHTITNEEESEKEEVQAEEKELKMRENRKGKNTSAKNNNTTTNNYRISSGAQTYVYDSKSAATIENDKTKQKFSP